MMNTELPIATLITKRQRELGIRSGELVRRAGYQSTNGGLRRLADLCQGDLSPKTRFLLDALPHAIEVPAAEVQAAVWATMDQIEEAHRAREEAEERAYRAAFRPHALWITERERPSSIVMAAFYGIERLLRLNLDAEKGEDSFVGQALAAMPSSISFFGRTTGFSVNYSPDRCVEFDSRGNMVATFPRARRLGSADVTLKNGQSLLGLFHVETEPTPEEPPDSVLH